MDETDAKLQRIANGIRLLLPMTRGCMRALIGAGDNSMFDPVLDGMIEADMIELRDDGMLHEVRR